MFRLILLAAFVAMGFGLGQQRQQIDILKEFNSQSPEGSYEYAYQTDNGIYVQEEGNVRSIKDELVDIIVRGSFLYKSPEGQEINLRYTADENGFHPEGDHLPTPPPIPLAILKALEWNAAHPEEQ